MRPAFTCLAVALLTLLTVSDAGAGSARSKPLVAVVGQNTGTELSDFVIPFAVLKQSGAADVLAVSTEDGPIRMWPAMRVMPDQSVASFDANFPEGADYVIVPAMVEVDAESPAVAWIRAQSAKGATIVSICDGAFVVAQAGLLAGHRATGHWASQRMREKKFPDTEWLRNTRYVFDGKVISSAGVSAALPLSLALVESIAGREQATRIAHEFGVDDWSARHDSDRFHVGFRMVRTALGNRLLHRRQPTIIALAPGIDDVALTFAADAFARTYRGPVLTVAESSTVRTRNGLVIVPDSDLAHSPTGLRTESVARSPARALDDALATIERRYGANTATLVAAQLEYPRQAEISGGQSSKAKR